MSTYHSWHYYLTKNGWQQGIVSRNSAEDIEERPKGTLVAVRLSSKESDWSMAERNYGRVIFRSSNLNAIKTALKSFGVPDSFSEHKINAAEVETYEIGKVVARPLRFNKSDS